MWHTVLCSQASLRVVSRCRILTAVVQSLSFFFFERLGHALLQQRKLLESTLPTLAFGAVPVAARDN